jgi:alpha-1,6-mannosyltransferase
MTVRIVDVCAFYTAEGGGVKTYVERKLKAAGPGAQEIIIVAPGETDGLIRREAGGSIITIAGPRFPFDRRYRYFDDEAALHALLDRLSPDVVEASSPWGSATMVGRWRGSALRSLVMHADPMSAYAYRWFGGVASRDMIDRGFDWFWRRLRRLDTQFDLVVSASRQLSDRLAAGGLTKMTTIPMGVEPGVFSPARRDEALRARLLARCGLGEDSTLLVGIGRLAPEKRWPMVIEAVTAAGYDQPVGFVLFGDGRDRAKVVRTAANNPHVHLAAPVTDRIELATILASADALVHGCEAETFCMVAAEAKASGLPLIVPDEGGAGDQFSEGQGALYTARNSASLAQAVTEFIASSAGAHRERAVRAAPYVLNMDDHFERLFATYAARLERLADVA